MSDDKINKLINQKKARSGGDTKKSQASKPIDKNEKNNDDFLANFNHGRYESKKPIYVDQDIHEVLMIIKNNSPFSLGDITSTILEAFVKEHISEIQNLGKKNNKYLNHG